MIFVVFAEDGELRRTLQSLACGKARVLVKKPKVHKTRWLFLPLIYPESLEWVLEFQLSLNFSVMSKLWVKQFEPISQLTVNFTDHRSPLLFKERVIIFFFRANAQFCRCSCWCFTLVLCFCEGVANVIFATEFPTLKSINMGYWPSLFGQDAEARLPVIFWVFLLSSDRVVILSFLFRAVMLMTAINSSSTASSNISSVE